MRPSATEASIVSSCFLLTQGQDTIATKISIAVEPLNPVAGQSVTLTPGVVLEDFKRCHWYRGVTAESEELIFTHTPPFYVPGAAYTRRETMGPGCSLHIRNLVPEDSGIYTVTLDESGMLSTTGHVDMEVSEILSRPVLLPVESVLAENRSVTLRCSTSDSSNVKVFWFKDGELLQAQAGLSEQNRTLTLAGASEDELGTYTCEARNPISNAISNPSIISSRSSQAAWKAEDIAKITAGVLTLILSLIGLGVSLYRCRGRCRTENTSTVEAPEPPTCDPPAYENVAIPDRPRSEETKSA
ncbi:cell adhesion molecule CEACAM16-like isoform X2 [Podarcis muralis]